MKASITLILIGVLSLPLGDAARLRMRESDVSYPVLIPTETELYEKYVCLNNPDGLKLLVPGSCSEYYECFNGVATVNSCAYLTPYYDPINQTCVSETNCVERPIEIDGGPVGCLGVCCGKTAGLYVDPTDKTQFYFCNGNVGILHSCCSGEQFNPITKACDVPANCPLERAFFENKFL